MKVGIIGAMDAEVDYLKGLLEDVRVSEWLRMEFFEGRLGGVDAIVVRCGVGKVNAALCAQAVVSRYGATHVINTGVAGSLDERVDIGDVVVATDALHHDISAEALGHPVGQVPNMDVFSFETDPELRSLAVASVAAVSPDAHVVEGRIVSGDQFVASRERKDYLATTFGALCCEMEGAAIAHACYLMGVPFVVVRTISDRADGQASSDYPASKFEVAERCAAFVEHMVRSMREDE